MEIAMTITRVSEYESFLPSTIRLLKCWYARYRQREQLLKLDDHALKDIGVSRADAVAEGTKPFWKR